MNPAAEAIPPPHRSYVWLVFVAAFALQLAVWTAWFIVAAKHQVADVPLQTAPHR